MDTTKLIELEIERILAQLQQMEASSEEYTAACNNLKTLREAATKRRADRWNFELWAPLVVGLIEVFSVLHYEELNVLTSKALSRVRFK